MSLPSENEEYNLEDIIHLNRIKNDNKSNYLVTREFTKNINLENKEYNIENIEDTKELLNVLSNIIENKINPNINKFVNMNYNNKKLEELYKSLESISKNKGSYKEILDIGNKIELIEKNKDNISDDEIENTIKYLRDFINIFSNFEYMLENRYFDYEN